MVLRNNEIEISTKQFASALPCLSIGKQGFYFTPYIRNVDIIIIGAGASGLMAAAHLAEAGLSVTILEARNRIGGRIHTVETGSESNDYYEAGAEFIHGRLPVTLQLLKQFGQRKKTLTGETWELTEGIWNKSDDFPEGINEVLAKLKSLDKDMAIAGFFEQFFYKEKYKPLVSSLTSYIEGYYSGDLKKCSAKTFLTEFESEDEFDYRPVGGYGRLINYLANKVTKAGGFIHLSTVVRDVKWQKDKVKIIDQNNKTYKAAKVLVTVPIGIWTAGNDEKGAIKYTPELTDKKDAAAKLGFGSVIKILFCFTEPISKNALFQQQSTVDWSNISFAITQENINTWWTQHPTHSPILTGWLAGPQTEKLKEVDDAAIYKMALCALSNILQTNETSIEQNLKWWKIYNWTADPYTRGAYSYSTLHTHAARQTVAEPVENTLFFAGEGLHKGTEMGTVEAALTSGKNAADAILYCP